jgi:hypothetical protein
MRLRFTKMQGAGNDFVVLDGTRAPVALTPAQARRLGDRRFGVGADQILVVEPRATPASTSATASSTPQRRRGRALRQRRALLRALRARARPDRQDRGARADRQPRARTASSTRRPRHRGHGRAGVRARTHALRRRGLQPRREGDFELWPLDLPRGPAEVAVLSMGNPHAVRASTTSTPRRSADGPLIETHWRFARASTPASCRCWDATASGCACGSAAPARRWPAAPAPARRWWPASGWAGSTQREVRRAAAGCASNGPAAKARRPRAHDRPGQTVFEGEIEL